MIKDTSTELEKMIADRTIVTVPRNHKKGKSISDFIDKTVGETGSAQRERFESEVKMEVCPL